MIVNEVQLSNFILSNLVIMLTTTTPINYHFIVFVIMFDVGMENNRPTPILISRCGKKAS